MKPDESTLDEVRNEIEELHPRAKAGDPAAQIAIARKLLNAVRQGKITPREGNGDAFRWVRTAEINPSITDEQRLGLAEVLLRDDKGDLIVPSCGTFQKAKRLLIHAYNHGPNDIRGKAARLLGDLYGGPFRFHGPQFRNIPECIDWLRRAAQAGNAMAALNLSIKYRNGLGVLANEDEARNWLNQGKQLSQTHSDVAAGMVCQQIEESLGTKSKEQKDFESAKMGFVKSSSKEGVCKDMSILRDLANKGYAPAMVLWVEEIYDTRQKRFYHEAKIYLRDAVRQGCPEALAFAGRWLLTGGRGVRQNIKLGRALLARAADLGNATALVHLSRCSRRGWGEHKNPSKAKDLWGQAKKRMTGQTDGRCWYELFRLKQLLEKNTSLPLLRKAAEGGDVQARYVLGGSYRRGLGVPIALYEAKEWLEKAAFRQLSWAQRELSLLIEDAKGKKKFSSRREEEELFLLEKAMNSGDAEAGVILGLRYLSGNTGSLRNRWEATRDAERLFRRFCPFCPEKDIAYSDIIINHFLAKPLSKRSARDEHFLEQIQAFLKKKDPARAARLFQTENPAFAAECTSLAAKSGNSKGDFEKRLQDMEVQLAEAESKWQSDNEKLRHHAENVFEKQARSILSPQGQNLYKFAREEAKTQPSIREMFFRCFWRTIQTYLRQDTWSVETKNTINAWMTWGLELYCEPQTDAPRWSTNPDTYPPVLRDAVLFCCQNDTKLGKKGLTMDTRVLIHSVAGALLNQSALTWLISFKDLWLYDFDDSKRKWVSIAADAKNPMALRKKADIIFIDSSNPQMERDEIAQLLWEAAIRGDAEAQCRQGEALLKDFSLLELDDYRLEIAKLLWDPPKNRDVKPQSSQDETLLNDMPLQELQRQALQWFQKAAEQGHARATVQLGRLLSEENSEEAIARFKEVLKKTDENEYRLSAKWNWENLSDDNIRVDQSLRASAEYECGKLLLRRQEPVKALRHLRAAAQNKNRAAMELLVLDPSLGKMLSDEEIRECCHSLLKMTDGDSPADMPLRRRVWTRLGQVEKSKSDRAIAFRKAAKSGDDLGAYEWARCLLFGDGCDRNLNEADKWFQEAQKRCQGHRDGNRDLAAQADSWHNCVFSMISEPIPPVPAQKRRELGLKTEPRP